MRKPNSELDHSTISAPRRERCVAHGRRSAQVVEDEVTVGDTVDRVRGHVGEAEFGRDCAPVGVEVGARERAGAQWHDVGGPLNRCEPLTVPQRHPEPGQKVVAQVHRLRALEVRVARQRPVDVPLGGVEQRLAVRRQIALGDLRGLTREHRDVGDDLVVA